MAEKKTGTSGYLIIDDIGGRVYFRLRNESSLTHIGNLAWSGTVNGSPVNGGVAINGTGTYQLGNWGVSTSQTVTLSIPSTGTSGLGGPASFSVQISRGLPGTPTDLAVTRVSDARMDLLWSRQDTYTAVEVARRTDDGPLQQVALVSGNAFSFTDTTTSAGHKYAYQVSGRTASGASPWSNVATAYTTPAAPTGVAAARAGSGIAVSASGVPKWATSFDVMDGSTVVASGVSLPWTHVAPSPSVTHQYTVRGVAPGPVAGVWSSPSNVVQLIAPPAAPTGLAPNGGVAASDEDVTFSWVHNPVDSSAQSAFEVQHRAPGGAWTTISGTTASQVTATLPVGDREWQVRTKGADPSFSPWSAVAVVTVIDRPGVIITQPGPEWESSTLPLVWTYFQAQSRPQSAWQVEVLDASLVVVESLSGSGAQTNVALSTRLVPGDWTVRVRAATGDVWSAWAEQPFTVAFDPPAPPLLSGAWSEETGVVTLTVAAGGVVGPVDMGALVQEDRWVVWDAVPDESTAEVVEPVPPETVRLLVERLDETTWVTLLDGTDGATFTDAESPSYGDIVYRATSFTAEGAASVTEIIVAARSDALWLSTGPGFAQTARLPMSPSVTAAASRDRVLKRYAGRSVPTTIPGEGTSKTWQVAGTVTDRTFIEPTVTPDELLAMAQDRSALFMFRDPDGRRLVGEIGEIQLGRQTTTRDSDPLRPWNAFWGFGFTITEATED